MCCLESGHETRSHCGLPSVVQLFHNVCYCRKIGLSNTLGCLLRGNDVTISEKPDGTKVDISYREALHSSLIIQSHFVWLDKGFKQAMRWAKALSKKYEKLSRSGSHFDGIVHHQARERLKRYTEGEKLDDFFQALMENKSGDPNKLEWGEIVAEISIMCKSRNLSEELTVWETV